MVILTSGPSHQTGMPDPEIGLWLAVLLPSVCQLNVERWNVLVEPPAELLGVSAAARRSGPCPPPVIATTCPLSSTLVSQLAPGL